MVEPFLLAGLGNPGPRYRMTRHNAGWLALDRIARSLSLDGSVWREKFGGYVAETRIPPDWPSRRLPAPLDEKLILFKPAKFMNLSGGPIRQALDWHQTSLKRFLAIVDDVNLPLGGIRLRERGSAGGHNGLKDIQLHMGGTEYCRLRIGVGAPRGGDMRDYVLDAFSEDELPLLDGALDETIECVALWLRGETADAMARYNGRGASADGDGTANGR